MACEYMLAISLYRVIGRIRVMTLHLGVLNGEIGMMDGTQDHLRDVSAKISCPADLGGKVYAHSYAYMCSEMFRLLCMTWGDVI